MGYIRHHAIIVTGTYGDYIKLAHKKAIDIFDDKVSEIVDSKLNSTSSFFIAPDGSKEGWAESAVGDVKRDEFIKLLNGMRYEDKSSPLAWAELFYGDDNLECKIARHADEVINTTNGDV